MADGTLTKQQLKSKSGEFDIESIHTVDLKKMDLSDVGCLGECVGLERLDLSYNDLGKLYALAGLSNLNSLNLSANRITSLEGLQSLDNLASLNLAGNLIGSVDTLRCLSSLEKLTDLRLKDYLLELSNPVCVSDTYKTDVCGMLPQLITLDGERLSGRGSDLFQTCEDLDSLIKARDQKTGPVSVSGRAGPWLPPDYWTEYTTDFDSSNLVDAEQQLEELLTDCRRITSAADDKLRGVKQKVTEVTGLPETSQVSQ